MKRRLLISLALVLVAFFAFGAWLFHPTRAAPVATLSFLRYTNDTRIRPLLFPPPDSRERTLAVFRLTNHTHHFFMYSHGATQVEVQGRWMNDTNFPAYSGSVMTGVGPAESAEITFPVPAGPGAWRCSVSLFDVTFSLPLGPVWRRQIIEIMRRTGVSDKFDRVYTVWSSEVPR